MSDKSTGEWTADYVDDRFDTGAVTAGAIADAHNEQLAAERDCSKRFEIQVDDCQKQLAAEREQVKFLEKRLKEEVELHEQEEKQLAVVELCHLVPLSEQLTYTEYGLVQYPDGSKAVMAWNKDEAKRLVEWVNAALAAERETVKHKEQEIDAYNKALAAEREKVAEVEEHNIRGAIHPDVLSRQIAQAQEAFVDKANVRETELICERDYFKNQLAADREKYVKQREDWISEIQQLQDQLDAERERYSLLEKEHDRMATEAAAEREKNRVKTTEYAKGWDDHVLAAKSQIEDLREQRRNRRDSK